MIELEPYGDHLGTPTSIQRFPGADPTVVFNTGTPIHIDMAERSVTVQKGQAFFAGVGTTQRTTRTNGFQQGIHLNLSLLDARILFGPTIRELADEPAVLLGELSTPLALTFERCERLSLEARVACISNTLQRLLRSKTNPEPEVLWAYNQFRANPAARIRSLASTLNWSRQRLSTRFTNTFGIAPKRFQRLIRFDALNRVLPATDRRLTDIAHELGYYDHAHMANEVKALSGLTPAQLRAAL